MKKHNNSERETMDIVLNGFIYTLVKGRCNNTFPPPCYMGYENWALQSIVKMKRKRNTKILMIRTK